MKSIVKIFLLYCICQIINFSVPANEIDLSKEYYIDLAGYHATGKGNSEDKEEAIRLAKSVAIKKIFTEIGKDEFFQQMFISTMPQFIINEGSQIEKIDNKYFAIVKIIIDQTAVIMMEDPYIHGVAELLNKSEKKIEEIEKFLKDAENAELNLRMSEALLFYRTAKLRCTEIDDLLKNIGDPSVNSVKGNNILILVKITKALNSTATGGFDRLEKIEVAMEKDSAFDELVKTFEFLINEIHNIEGIIIQNSDLEPFYDIPKSRLESIKIDIKNAIEKSNSVNDKLLFLSKQIPDNRLLLKEKIAISLDELALFISKLNKMKKDVELEIFDPRLVRQQRAQNWNYFFKVMGNTFEYIFLHNPDDILAFRYNLPFEWPVDSNIQLSNNNEFYIRAEKAFTSGFYIKAQLNIINTFLLNSNTNSALYQELALGYFRDRFLMAASLVWDWERKINSTNIEKEKSLKIMFGGVNIDRSRADWLLSFSYQFPQFLDPFFIAYQINGSIDLLIRIENILLLEASILSNAIQDSVVSTTRLELEDLQYKFNCRLGLGLRFPGPIIWGVYYNYNLSAPINPISFENDFGSFQEKNYWGGYIEYSF